MKLLRPLFFGACAICAGVAGAQPVLTPEEAVHLALSRPDVIALVGADILEAEAGLVEARLWANPVLSVERDAGEPARGELDETSVMLSQTFALGPRRGLERRAARLGVDAARAGTAAHRAELRAEVLRDYFLAVTARRRQTALADSIAQLERIDRIAVARRDSGDLSGFAQRRIAQQVERARLRRDAADADLALAEAELAARIGIEVEALQLPRDIEVLPTVSGAPQGGSSPAMDALAAKRAQAQAALDAARRWQVPLTVGIGQKRFQGASGRDDALLLEFALPLPMFDRHQAERERAAAAWQRADATHRLAMQHAVTRRAAADQQLRQRIDSARMLQSDLLPQAREVARIAEASFAEGELDLLGLLAALDEERDASEQSLASALDARLAVIEFERMYPKSPMAGE
jgi:outer membrane protein, heavy metal efflux system